MVGLGENNKGTQIQKYMHYRSKVWGHLEMSLFLKEKHIFLTLK